MPTQLLQNKIFKYSKQISHILCTISQNTKYILREFIQLAGGCQCNICNLAGRAITQLERKFLRRKGKNLFLVSDSVVEGCSEAQG